MIKKLLLFSLFVLPFFLKDNISIIGCYSLIGIVFFVLNSFVYKKNKQEYKTTKEFIFFLLFVVVSICSGMLGILLSKDVFTSKDIIRDILYISSGVIICFSAINVFKFYEINIKFSEVVTILYASVFFVTTIYLIQIFMGLNYNVNSFLDLNAVFWAKREAGEIPNLTSIGLGALLILPHKKRWIHKLIILYGIIGSIIFISRTSILIILIAWLITLFAKNKITLSLLLKTVVLMCLLIPLVMFFLGHSFNYDSASIFTDKIKNSISEIQFWKKETFLSTEEIQNNWRAFESQKAIENMDTFSEFLVGKGLGSYVPLDLYMNLSGEDFSRVPIIHNGLIYMIYKCGILGITAYLIGFVKLFKLSKVNTYQKQMLLFVFLLFIINLVTTTSLYNVNFSYSLWIILILTKYNFFSKEKFLRNTITT